MDDYDRLAREHAKAPRRVVDHSVAWSKLEPVSVVNGSLRDRILAFAASKRITLDALVALDTRIDVRGKGPSILLAWGYQGRVTGVTAVKFRDIDTGERVTLKPSVFQRPLMVGNRGSLDVFFAEGETDAARIYDLVGQVAMIHVLPAGAKTFKREWVDWIPRGATAYLAHDADDSGDKGAEKAAGIIGHAIRIRPPEGDWSEWPGTRAEFMTIVSEARRDGLATPGSLIVAEMLGMQRKVAKFIPGMRLRAPAGTVAILTGRPSIGKGLLEVLEAAGVSKAGGCVLIASEEDSAAHTILPRLEAAGADLSRVKLVTGLALPKHTMELVARSEELGVQLLVVDPWTNHVGDIDVDRGQELRAALMSLKSAAERVGFVALLTAHPNKNSENPDPLERVAHASALTQVARSVFWIESDPTRLDDDATRLVAHVKHNLTARDDTIEMRIDTVRLHDPDQTVPIIVETGTTSLDWLAIHKLKHEHDHARPAPARDEAWRFVRNYLRDQVSRAAKASAIINAGIDEGLTRGRIMAAGQWGEKNGLLERTRAFGWFLTDPGSEE